MAYFVPDDLALYAIEDALRRGVRVRSSSPGENIDAGTVRSASRALWGGILRAGAELYEFQPTMYHCKVLVVDSLWVSGRLDELRQPLLPPETTKPTSTCSTANSPRARWPISSATSSARAA
jgi:phosphatidylserine/phosphatidylglycerophosphate/cardiolipin synthase-like enzyme